MLYLPSMPMKICPRPTPLYSAFTPLIIIRLNSGYLFWIPDHINLPDHDAVDHAAEQSLLSPSITDPSLLPVYDVKSYYHSLISNSWRK